MGSGPSTSLGLSIMLEGPEPIHPSDSPPSISKPPAQYASSSTDSESPSRSPSFRNRGGGAFLLPAAQVLYGITHGG